MKVIVKPNKNNAALRLAFIQYKNSSGEECSCPAFFDKKLLAQPEVGKEVEVMITGVMYHKDANDYYDFNRPKCFFIAEPIKGTHTKVWYDGFECSGSMCQTLTSAHEMVSETSYKKDGKTMTPGKLMSSLIVADNVSDGTVYNKPTPGIGWAERHPENGKLRLAGVEDVRYLNLHIKYE